MCAVNDRIRQMYDQKINSLKAEYKNEENKSVDIERAKGEVLQLVDAAQCAIDNISQCDFGGDKILSSVTTSQQGYKERMDFYDDYLMKCKKAMEEIKTEITETTALRNAVPENCGACSECCPPTKKVKGGV